MSRTAKYPRTHIAATVIAPSVLPAGSTHVAAHRDAVQVHALVLQFLIEPAMRNAPRELQRDHVRNVGREEQRIGSRCRHHSQASRSDHVIALVLPVGTPTGVQAKRSESG
jgi:hypothetical protein